MGGEGTEKQSKGQKAREVGWGEPLEHLLCAQPFWAFLGLHSMGEGGRDPCSHRGQ